jgi:hypothetical protein
MFNAWMRSAPQAARIFGVFPSDSYMESWGSMGGVGRLERLTPLARPVSRVPTQQYRKDFFHDEFALGIPIARTLMQDGKFNMLGQFGRLLGQAASRTSEEDAATALDGGFSSTLAEDGSSLFNDAHTNVDGAESQDNLTTSELTYANATTIANTLMLQTDYDGDLIDATADTLIVPVNKQQKAFEIIRSSGDPTNAANRDGSWHTGRYTAIVWPRLDKLGTTNATTRWYMADSRYLPEILKWFWRVPPEMIGDGDLMAGKREVAVYYRASWGAVRWQGIIGNNASS